MNTGKTLFAQLMDFLPWTTFTRVVERYVLVAIIKKRLDLDASLYTLLQILSVTLFEKMPLHQALAGDEAKCSASQITNQLNLFTF